MRKNSIVRKTDRLGRPYGPYFRIKQILSNGVVICTLLDDYKLKQEEFMLSKPNLCSPTVTTLALSRKSYDQLKNTAGRRAIDHDRTNLWLNIHEHPTELVSFRTLNVRRRLTFKIESVELKNSLGDKLVRINFAKRLE